MLDLAVRNIVAKALTDLLGYEGRSVAELLAARLPEMLLRVDTVCAIVGLSVATIYRLMSVGDFPRPLRLSSHARGWKLSEVAEWMNTRKREGADLIETDKEASP